MARDYAKRSSRSKKQSPFTKIKLLVLFLSVIVIVSVIAFAVHKKHEQKLESVNVVTQGASDDQSGLPPVESLTSGSTPSVQEQLAPAPVSNKVTSVSLTPVIAKNAKAAAPSVRFNFYSMLSNVDEPSSAGVSRELQLQQSQPVVKKKRKKKVLPKAKQVIKSAPSGPYYTIQLGSFSDQNAASQEQGRLSRLGFDSQVTEANISGQTVYRLQMGHYATLKKAQSVQNLLQSQRITSMVRLLGS